MYHSLSRLLSIRLIPLAGALLSTAIGAQNMSANTTPAVAAIAAFKHLQPEQQQPLLKLVTIVEKQSPLKLDPTLPADEALIAALRPHADRSINGSAEMFEKHQARSLELSMSQQEKKEFIDQVSVQSIPKIDAGSKVVILGFGGHAARRNNRQGIVLEAAKDFTDSTIIFATGERQMQNQEIISAGLASSPHSKQNECAFYQANISNLQRQIPKTPIHFCCSSIKEEQYLHPKGSIINRATTLGNILKISEKVNELIAKKAITTTTPLLVCLNGPEAIRMHRMVEKLLVEFNISNPVYLYTGTKQSPNYDTFFNFVNQTWLIALMEKRMDNVIIPAIKQGLAQQNKAQQSSDSQQLRK